MKVLLVHVPLATLFTTRQKHQSWILALRMLLECKLKQLENVEIAILLVKAIQVEVASPAFVAILQRNVLISSGVQLIMTLMDYAHALSAKTSIMDKR